MDETSAAYSVGLWAGRVFLLCIGLALLTVGVVRTKRGQGGGGGWIGAGIVVALLTVAATASQLVSGERLDGSRDVAGPPPIQDTSVEQVFADCDQAMAALLASYQQVIAEAEAGRVDAMRAALSTMLRNPTDNPTCFDPEFVAGFEEIGQADPDDENLDYGRIDEACWIVERDAATLMNFAGGLGQASPGDAERVLTGLTVLSANDQECLPAEDAAEMAASARESWGA